MPVLQDASVRSDSEEDPKGRTWQDKSLDQPPDEVEELFYDLCSIDDNSSECNHPYYGSLEIMLHARRMRPITVRHFNKMISFMGRITPDVRQLLLDRDSVTLLILAHWLYLLLGIRQWWLKDRAERECKAIVIFLRVRALKQNDERLLRLLHDPAQAVGVEI